MRIINIQDILCYLHRYYQYRWYYKHYLIHHFCYIHYCCYFISIYVYSILTQLQALIKGKVVQYIEENIFDYKNGNHMPNKSDINIDLLNNYENENSSSSLTLVSYKNKAQRDGRHDYFPKNEDHIIFPVTASSCPR